LNKHFWNWVKNETGERTLYLDGAISSETWLGDEITPQKFKSELTADSGDITVWVNSPGGCFFAASQIYNMLRVYPGKVTVKIDSLAASAASVIAMAGDEVLISPVGMLMIHNPITLAFGDAVEMEKAIDMLGEVKESIMNAYQVKTGLSRAKLSRLMDDESWINARKAVELGFADRILFMENPEQNLGDDGLIFSKVTVLNSIYQKLPKKETKTGLEIQNLYKRLDLLKI
jgi:ATP-dependent Clp protease, protease subunit